MKLETIFAVALEQTDPTARAAYLDTACAGDRALRRHVEALLQSAAEVGDFLESPPVELDAPGPHTRIGPYKLLQQIGDGGMGTVYMAEQQQPVRRRVALKIIKPGMDSAQVSARFEAERQALALMDHPNIARVLDAGTTETGRPYFVMELVQGVTITEYCDQNQLTPRERLALFIPVCQALQHAHQKGIIHRDVKPANVMVTLHDGKPVPKVIDFGVAKAIDQRLTERTLFTTYGQVVGTLEYMSPEQAELSGLDVDTRSDVYALGVLAYELLTGSTPLQRQTLRASAYAEVLRQIREAEPPAPSTRLNDSGQRLATISAQRKMEPAQLARLVRGELDWIVMKALDKDRNRRYETASSLARDVERFLADEPVEACPPSRSYRLRKLLRRHQGPALAATLIVLALLGGIVGTTWGMLQADQARHAEAEQRALAEERKQLAEANERKALAEKQVAQAVQTFLQRDLLRQASATEQADAIREQGGGFAAQENPTIKELLERAAAELTPAKIARKFPDQPAAQASILFTVGDTYRGIGEYAKAEEFLVRASDLYRDLLTANHPTALAIRHRLAWTCREAGKLSRAIELFEEVAAIRRQDLGPEHPETLDTLEKLAVTYRKATRLPEAIALFAQVRDAQVKTLGAEHPATLATRHNLAWAAYLKSGNAPEALAAFAQVRDAQVQALGADHPSTLSTRGSYALVYLDTGKLLEGIALHEQVRDAMVQKLGPEHPTTLTVQHNLAAAYKVAGKLPQAIALFEQVHALEKQKLGAEHPLTLSTLSYLALTHRAAGNSGPALQLYRQAVRGSERRNFQDEYAERYVRALTHCLEQAQQYAEAETWRRKWLAVVQERSGATSLAVAAELALLGANLLQQEKWHDAEPVLRACGAIRARAEPAAWTTFHTTAQLGGALLGQQQYAEAETLLLAGYEGMKQREATIPASGKVRLTETLERLVQLYERWDKQEQGAAWHQRLQAARQASSGASSR